MLHQTIPTLLPDQEYLVEFIDKETKCSILHNEYFHRLNMTMFVFCIEGELTLSINLKEFVINRNALITIPNHSVLQFNAPSETFQGFLVAFSHKFLSNVGFNKSVIHAMLTSTQHEPIIHYTEERANLTKQYLELLRFATTHQQIGDHLEIIQTMLMSFIYSISASYQIRSVIPSKNKKEKEKPSRYEFVFDEFVILVMENYQTNRTVQFYADKLFITSKHLNLVVKEMSGEVASHLIAKVVILDAKAQLRAGNKTVKEISDSLNFPSPTFFGKFFKRYTCIAPGSFAKGRGK